MWQRGWAHPLFSIVKVSTFASILPLHFHKFIYNFVLPKKTDTPSIDVSSRTDILRKMANLFGPDQVPNDRRGVREVVQTHRAARIRRQDASSVRAQHELRLSDLSLIHI